MATLEDRVIGVVSLIAMRLPTDQNMVFTPADVIEKLPEILNQFPGVEAGKIEQICQQNGVFPSANKLREYRGSLSEEEVGGDDTETVDDEDDLEIPDDDDPEILGGSEDDLENLEDDDVEVPVSGSDKKAERARTLPVTGSKKDEKEGDRGMTNFLKNSHTYCSLTRGKVPTRHEILLKYIWPLLMNGEVVTVGKAAKILAENGQRLKRSDLNNDIPALRTVHAYYHGNAADKRAASERAKNGKDPVGGILRRLLTDKLDTWEKLLEAKPGEDGASLKKAERGGGASSRSVQGKGKGAKKKPEQSGVSKPEKPQAAALPAVPAASVESKPLTDSFGEIDTTGFAIPKGPLANSVREAIAEIELLNTKIRPLRNKILELHGKALVVLDDLKVMCNADSVASKYE